MLDGERQYSQFAFEALAVEASVDVPNLEDILFEFAGLGEVVSSGEVEDALRRVGITDTADQAETINHLIALSFLGREVREAAFEFAEDPRELKRLDAVARRFASSEGREPRLRIHPAYQAYLDIAATDDVAQQALKLQS